VFNSNDTIRFGWNWKGSAQAGRDVIRLGIGPAPGTAWWNHWIFWVMAKVDRKEGSSAGRYLESLWSGPCLQRIQNRILQDRTSQTSWRTS
jgi:hypothetical protein